MRDLVLRRTLAACQHGTRPVYLTLHLHLHQHHSTFQQRRQQSNHTTAIDPPRISAEPRYAIKGLVPNLDTTRPAALDLPEAPHPYAWPSSQSKNPTRWDFKYLFRLGKTYGAFYWQGMKNVYANYKTRQKIVRRLNGTPPDMAARNPASPQRISYNEYETLIRFKRDLKKLVPFALVLAICGEFTPLVILMLGSGVVPATCVIPKQVTQDRKKTLERESTYIDLMVDTWSKRLASIQRSDKQPESKSKTHTYLLPDAYRLHLTPFINLTGLTVDLYWRYRLAPRLRTHSNEILSTAVLVLREGGWSKRSPLDMWEWGNKYGMYRLRQYTRDAIDRGEDPVSEDMKTILLRHFDQETKAIVNAAQRNGKLDYEHHDPLVSDRPDGLAMRKDIERMAKEREREQEQEAKDKDKAKKT